MWYKHVCILNNLLKYRNKETINNQDIGKTILFDRTG